MRCRHRRHPATRHWGFHCKTMENLPLRGAVSRLTRARTAEAGTLTPTEFVCAGGARPTLQWGERPGRWAKSPSIGSRREPRAGTPEVFWSRSAWLWRRATSPECRRPETSWSGTSVATTSSTSSARRQPHVQAPPAAEIQAGGDRPDGEAAKPHQATHLGQGARGRCSASRKRVSTKMK